LEASQERVLLNQIIVSGAPFKISSLTLEEVTEEPFPQVGKDTPLPLI